MPEICPECGEVVSGQPCPGCIEKFGDVPAWESLGAYIKAEEDEGDRRNTSL